MRRLMIIFCFLVFFLSFYSNAKASLISVDQKGDITWKVLAEESSFDLKDSKKSYIEIKKIAQQEARQGSKISLLKDGDKVNLVVSSGNETRELSLSDENKELVEVTERQDVQRIIIGTENGEFSLEQNGIKAKTTMPINIDSEKARLSVVGTKGEDFLTVLPWAAAESALRSRLVTQVSKNGLEIFEGESGLQYKVNGEKIINFFDFYRHSIAMTVYISAVTGEVVNVDSPTLLKYLRFLYI